MSAARPCPRAHPVTPHDMRQDDRGRWYCPIERDAEWAAEQAAARRVEVAS